VARLEGVLAPAAKEFVLLRITRMRGVDLDLFDFDFDLTWMGFFLSADEEIYGRYGGRDAESPERRASAAGLRFAMDAALRAHSNRRPMVGVARPPGRTVDRFRSAQTLSATACVHCHQIYEFRRQDLQASGEWRTDELWVYPMPENIGLTLDVDRGDRITTVTPASSAARLGLAVGDRLVRVNGYPIASFADLQYALHCAPAAGRIPVVWERDGKPLSGLLELTNGWRKTDISWRWSLRSLDPAPGVHGDDLTAQEKQALGLGPKRLAFRQGNFVSMAARQADIRQNDIIIGIDNKELEMTARQFAAYVRLNYKVGDRVVYNILRGGRRIDVPLTLANGAR
jgi:hypothetical protein